MRLREGKENQFLNLLVQFRTAKSIKLGNARADLS